MPYNVRLLKVKTLYTVRVFERFLDSDISGVEGACYVLAAYRMPAAMTRLAGDDKCSFIKSVGRDSPLG